jgi:hypothetical protein
LDLRRLRVVKNADAPEARKAVVILEHDYEYVIEPWDLVMVILACKGLRSGHAHRERQSDCQAAQLHDLSPRLMIARA